MAKTAVRNIAIFGTLELSDDDSGDKSGDKSGDDVEGSVFDDDLSVESDSDMNLDPNVLSSCSGPDFSECESGESDDEDKKVVAVDQQTIGTAWIGTPDIVQTRRRRVSM